VAFKPAHLGLSAEVGPYDCQGGERNQKKKECIISDLSHPKGEPRRDRKRGIKEKQQGKLVLHKRTIQRVPGFAVAQSCGDETVTRGRKKRRWSTVMAARKWPVKNGAQQHKEEE